MVDAANMIKKLLIVQYKLIRKPMNQYLIKFFKARHSDGLSQSFFQRQMIKFGQLSHRIEVRID